MYRLVLFVQLDLFDLFVKFFFSLLKYVNKKKLIDKRFDIADYKKLEKNVLEFKPDIIYHLAAQSLVRKSVTSPLETFKTNILGTANILNCINKLKKKNKFCNCYK